MLSVYAFVMWGVFMERVMRRIIAFLKDERAATAIEYGLIATGIALAIIPAVTGVGARTKAVFTAISTALK
jgi:pilus assembly protein Flp/PilA